MADTHLEALSFWNLSPHCPHVLSSQPRGQEPVANPSIPAAPQTFQQCPQGGPVQSH